MGEQENKKKVLSRLVGTIRFDLLDLVLFLGDNTLTMEELKTLHPELQDISRKLNHLVIISRPDTHNSFKGKERTITEVNHKPSKLRLIINYVKKLWRKSHWVRIL